MDGSTANIKQTALLTLWIRLFALAACAAVLSTRHRRSLHEVGLGGRAATRESEREDERNGDGGYAEHNLNLYRAWPVSWQDCFSSAIKAIVTELDEFFLMLRSLRSLSLCLSLTLGDYYSFFRPRCVSRAVPRRNSACMFYAIYCYMVSCQRRRRRKR